MAAFFKISWRAGLTRIANELAVIA
jgi:hypothetical protein